MNIAVTIMIILGIVSLIQGVINMLKKKEIFEDNLPFAIFVAASLVLISSFAVYYPIYKIIQLFVK